MSLYWQDGPLAIYHGDALEVLRQMPDESVNCCVTSPPYWGLRDYGVEGQLGLERTPEEYIAKMVAVFAEVRRVLRSDGTLWLNCGDSYNAHPGQRTVHDKAGYKQTTNRGSCEAASRNTPALKAKDLVGIPWMLAFALRADGWYLRQDITWSKPNPMPESVRDRCTKAHEYLFLFAKGQWKSSIVRFSDLSGERVHFGKYIGAQKPDVREALTKFCVSLAASLFESAQAQNDFSLPPFYSQEWKQVSEGIAGDSICDHPSVSWLASLGARLLSADLSTKEFLQKLDSFWLNLAAGDALLIGRVHSLLRSPAVNVDAYGAITVEDSGEICKIDFSRHEATISRPSGCVYYYDADAIAEAFVTNPPTRPRNFAGESYAMNGRLTPLSTLPRTGYSESGKRNKHSVWEISTEPFPEAHFATFPTELIKPCILAGCPVGGTVLDPFCGSGTTLRVAESLNCQSVGIELNAEYIEIAKRRLRQPTLAFGT